MTDDPEQLSELLGAKASEGRFVDSSGFTIDQLKAREKLSRYQLSDGGLWLVKLTQAAVAAGAPNITISFGRRKTRVAFEPSQSWDAETLLRTAFDDHAPADRAMGHLAVGMLGASGGLSQELKWSVGDSMVELGPTGSRVSHSSGGRELVFEATRPSRGIAWSKLLVAPLEQVFRQTLEEWAAVSARCWVSPIPILLDGRPLRQGYDAVPQVRLHGRVPRRATGLHRCLGLRSLSGPFGRPILPGLVGESELEVATDRGFIDRFGNFLRWRPAGLEPRGVLSVHSSVMVGPTVDFVCDGVVVESRLIEPMLERMRECGRLERPLLMPRYIFAVTPQELDLGGFAVRDLDHVQLVREMFGESIELLDLIEQRLDEYRARAADEPAMIRHGLKILREMYERLR